MPFHVMSTPFSMPSLIYFSYILGGHGRQLKLLTLCHFARFQGSSACLVQYIYEKYIGRTWTAIKIAEIQKSLEGLIVTL